MEPIVSIYTPGKWELTDSYGLIACQLGRRLARMGAHVNAMSLEKCDPASQPSDIQELLETPIRASLGGILLGYPNNHWKHGGMALAGPRVAITMFESTKLPSGWVGSLNECTAVIVPSTFCEEVFLAEGVTAPITVIPLGIDDSYHPVHRNPAANPFTFLAFADRGRRKGAHDAIQAFLKAFGDDPCYRLLLKSRERVLEINILNDNIEMIQQDMNTDELYALYQSAHCMIFASKGEGFGLPPREFAASGGAVIATVWSGTAEHIEEWGIPLSYALGPAWVGHHEFEKYGLGQWAEPDVDSLAVLMRYVASERQQVLDEAYARAAAVPLRYSWDGFAEDVYAVWLDALERWKRGKRNAA
jgi:glycosyltransferase involved in cell wall biosynthesis